MESVRCSRWGCWQTDYNVVRSSWDFSVDAVTQAVSVVTQAVNIVSQAVNIVTQAVSVVTQL